MTDTRSRCTLARSKLLDYLVFCERNGWLSLPCKGEYEVLRMKHYDFKLPLIVHQSGDTNSMHLTTQGHSDEMLKRFLIRKGDV